MVHLTLPRPGPDALGPYRRRYLQRTLRLLLDWPWPLPPWLRGPYADLRERLAERAASAPQEVLATLSLPVVGAPLRAAGALPDPSAALAEAVPHLLLELARRRALGTGEWFWGAQVSSLRSPSLGWTTTLPRRLPGVLFADGAVSLRLGSAGPAERSLEDPWTSVLGSLEVSHDYLPLAGGGWLALSDNNPLATLEAHPDKAGNAVDLGDTPAARWIQVVEDARSIVAHALPGLALEHASLLALLVPVGTHGERSLSASVREALFVVYLSLHPSVLTMAEALIHEVQHNKLNLLTFSDPILLDGAEACHVSPVRPDPRPLWGLLLAVHAFQPVAELYLNLRDAGHPLSAAPGFAARLTQVLEANEQALRGVRDAGHPTPLGRELLEEMEHLGARQHERARTTL